jgi:hypothetical protein
MIIAENTAFKAKNQALSSETLRKGSEHLPQPRMLTAGDDQDDRF